VLFGRTGPVTATPREAGAVSSSSAESFPRQITSCPASVTTRVNYWIHRVRSMVTAVTSRSHIGAVGACTAASRRWPSPATCRASSSRCRRSAGSVLGVGYEKVSPSQLGGLRTLAGAVAGPHDARTATWLERPLRRGL
jgi:hypothetical protein